MCFHCYIFSVHHIFLSYYGNGDGKCIILSVFLIAQLKPKFRTTPAQSGSELQRVQLKPEFRTTTAQSGSELQGDEETCVNANEEESSYGLNENTESGSQRSEGRGNDANDVCSILFPDDANNDSFIDLNAPANRTPQVRHLLLPFLMLHFLLLCL
jgi:hypothetical protein